MVKFHSLHHELDMSRMKPGESIQDYISRVLDIVYQIRMLKEEVPVKMVVSKVLRSLTLRFMHFVHFIVKAKNLNTLTIDELTSFLKSHKSLLNLESEQEGEKALFVRAPPVGEPGGHGSMGHSRGCYRGRAQEKRHGRSTDFTHNTEANKQNNGV